MHDGTVAPGMVQFGERTFFIDSGVEAFALNADRSAFAIAAHNTLGVFRMSELTGTESVSHVGTFQIRPTLLGKVIGLSFSRNDHVVTVTVNNGSELEVVIDHNSAIE